MGDQLGWTELRGRVLQQMTYRRQAAAVYRDLLHSYPDNSRYHEALQEALQLSPAPGGGGVTPEQQDALKALYAELQAEFPRSSAAFRIPLNFLVRPVSQRAIRCSERNCHLSSHPF